MLYKHTDLKKSIVNNLFLPQLREDRLFCGHIDFEQGLQDETMPVSL